MPTDGCMDKENMTCTYNEILFRFKKEVLSHATTEYIYAKWNKPSQKQQTIYDSTYVRYP